jgi:hypothetical protein
MARSIQTRCLRGDVVADDLGLSKIEDSMIEH